MKKLMIVLLFLGASAFAKDIEPKSFGAQFMSRSISGRPNINFTFSVNAADLKPMAFSAIDAAVIVSASPAPIEVPAGIIYRKSPSTQIVGSEAFVFSVEGAPASQIIKDLRNSKIVMKSDSGFELSIDLKAMCASHPESFLDLVVGKSGCDMN